MSTKVFVGNLVFSTTGEELKAAFSPSAPVISANIITRGRRSLGYGFVEFATEAEAEKAVAEMDKKEIAGRAINAQVARPRDPAKEAEVREKRAAARAAKPRQPRAPKAEGSDAAAASSSAAPASTDAAPAANGGRRGGRRGQPRAAAPATTEGAAAPAEGAAAPANTRGRRGPGGRRNASSTGGAAASSAPRRQREPQEQRPASETTLFVANVPFSTDDAQLRSFFAEHNPKSAHVVRMRNGRSRGYGFVEFETAEGQKAGLAVDGKEVSLPNGTSLKLSVKIAMTPPPVQASDAAASSSAPAAESK